MATIAGSNLTTPRALARPTLAQPIRTRHLNRPWPAVHVRPLRAAPDSISNQVEKSIKDAEQTCSDDPKSGECVAAWDNVEELSAAASHARDKKKAGGSDPLESYCKDNPETDECRTYDN